MAKFDRGNTPWMSQGQKVVAEAVCATSVTPASAQCWRWCLFGGFLPMIQLDKVYHHLLIWFVAVIHKLVTSKKSSRLWRKFYFLCCVWIFTVVSYFLRTEVQENESGYQREYKGTGKKKKPLRFLSAITLWSCLLHCPYHHRYISPTVQAQFYDLYYKLEKNKRGDWKLKCIDSSEFP